MRKVFIDLEVLVPGASKCLDQMVDKISGGQAGIDMLNMFNEEYLKSGDAEQLKISSNKYNTLRNNIYEGKGEYKDKLDYGYIYNEDNLDRDLVKYFLFTYYENKKYVVYYYNTENEKSIKNKLIYEALPGCKPLPVKYLDKSRQKQSMPQAILEILKREDNKMDDFKDCVFIGKTYSVCDEFKAMNASIKVMSSDKEILLDKGKRI